MKKSLVVAVFSVVVVCSGCTTTPVAYQVDAAKIQQTKQQARQHDAIGEVVWVNPPLAKQQR
jgi:protein involved in sex pheromone biosynthesis